MGGDCEVQDDGSVLCSPPSIRLSATPLTCNLAYVSAPAVVGQSFRYSREFGRACSGFVGPPPGLYQFGATYNLTRWAHAGGRASRR